MRFDTSQQLRLSQQMKLGPRMIQSMEILQMPMMALQERIEQELEANVALEQVEGRQGDEQVRDEDDERFTDGLGEREMRVGDEARTDNDDWARLSVHESSYGAVDNQYSAPRHQPGERDRKLDAMANIAARGASLTEQLLQQWSFAEVEDKLRPIGEVVIGAIGADGLLEMGLEEVREQHAHVPGLSEDPEQWDAALSALQRWLDPPGMAARTKAESLLLQVDALMTEEPDVEGWEDAHRLIDEHFDDLLQNRLPRIVQATGLSHERIQVAKDLMRRLNPSPGRDLVEVDVPPITPDVIVDYDEETGDLHARFSRGHYPALCVSERYQKMAKDRAVDKETREFVGTNVRNAQWLIDSIQQRQNTLLRVVRLVLARQADFFRLGPQALKPLPMVEVADQLGVHVGTVSRAVSEKWLQTPRGLVPLRKFFSGGTRDDSGREMSWDAVKAKLVEIVDAEDKAKPFSDEALARELKKQGIEIARRTVVKYRQQLEIPPARRRKVWE